MDLENFPVTQATSVMQRKPPVRRTLPRPTDRRSTDRLQVPSSFVASHISGYDPLTRLLNYRIPAGKVAEIDYSLAGSHSEDPVYLTLYLNEVPVLAFPCRSPDELPSFAVSGELPQD
ncbi:MAG: hypothetical protein M3Y56_00770 [Armatimonadota bacterium]|nr:hypothetical protein [Armatimonadota bacterium]